MSIKKLLNSDSINNKTLKIYSDSITVKDAFVENVSIENSIHTGDLIVNGNNFNITNGLGSTGYVLATDGAGNLAWAPDNTGGSDVSFDGSAPTVDGELPLFSGITGRTIKESGVLLSDVQNDIDSRLKKDGTEPMTGNLDMGINNIVTSGLVDGVDVSGLPSAISAKVNKSGDTMSGNLNMGNFDIQNIKKVLLNDGSPLDPSLSFTNSPLSGFYRPNNNEITAVCNQEEIIKLTTAEVNITRPVNCDYGISLYKAGFPAGAEVTGSFYKLMTSQTVANSIIETSLFNDLNSIGTRTIPANFLQVGSSINVLMGGTLDTVGAVAQGLRIRCKLGGVTFADTGIMSTINGPGDNWNIRMGFTVRSTGALGTFINTGSFTTKNVYGNLNLTTTSTIDTTISNLFEITAQWSVADPLNIITSQICTINSM